MIQSTHAVFAASLAVFAATSPLLRAGVITLETPALGAALYDQDWRPNGGFFSDGAFFNNAVSEFETFSGFALSRVTDNTTPGFSNQFSAFAGSGASGSLQYAIGYVDTFGAIPTITLPEGERALSIEITNDTYPALSMRNGDSFAKKFGGPTGNDPDYFVLTISGLDAADGITGTVNFYLADYRFVNNSEDYILNTWTMVDLSALPENTRKLRFGLASSDNGAFGMNTPAYFAADNLTTVPEPTGATLLLLAAGVVTSRRQRMRQ
jgi:hypothetical protein